VLAVFPLASLVCGAVPLPRSQLALVPQTSNLAFPLATS